MYFRRPPDIISPLDRTPRREIHQHLVGTTSLSAGLQTNIVTYLLLERHARAHDFFSPFVIF